MTELAAWVLFPAIALAVCAGVGLLAARAAGLALRPALVPPLGFCGAICMVGVPSALGVPAWGCLAVLVVAAVAGFLAGGGEARAALRPGPAAAAGAFVYALYMAPVVLAGSASFLGYNLLNDTAIHLALVDYIGGHGRQLVDLEPSSYASAVVGYLGKDYPIGSHELLAALRAAVPLDAAELYQPFLALSAGLTAAAVSALSGLEGRSRWLPAAAAGLALSGQLIFSFDLQGGIKELTFLAAMATAAGLGRELLRGESPARHAGLVAIAGAAAYAIYGLAAIAWLAPLALLILAWPFVVPGSALRRRLLPAVAVAALVFVIAAGADLVPSVRFYQHGESTLKSGQELGPLVGPLRFAQASGVWLKGDYRQLPDSAGRRSYLLIGIALALALAGVALVLRRRDPGPLLLLLPSLLAWLVVSRTASPYVDAKLLAVLSPAVLLFSAFGVAALWSRLGRLEGAVAAVVLLGAVFFSDALAYRVALNAPMDRLDELTKISERFAGRGPNLVNEYEEYGKHFGRAGRMVDPYEFYTPSAAQLLDPKAPFIGHPRDLDELRPAWVGAFPLVTVRHSPAASRPGSEFQLAYRGHFYDVYRKAGPVPAGHIPYGTPESAAAVPSCGELRKLRGPLIAAERPAAVVFDIAAANKLPTGWKHVKGLPLAIDAGTGGSVSASAPLTSDGGFEVWLRGSAHRDLTLSVDGHRVGTVRAINTPGQWMSAGTIDLGAGPHTVTVSRPRRSLSPGDGQSDRIGPVALVRTGEPRLVRVASGAALCGRALDWVERP